MTIKILIARVEVSDQYGTYEDKIIGAFDDDDKIALAIENVEQKYKTKRMVIKTYECLINVPCT